MKRFFTVVVLLSAMAIGMQAQGVKFGIKGGLDVTSMSFDKKVFDSSNKAGWFIGPTVQVSLPLGFGADIAAFYDQKSTKLDEESITMKSILVPVNLRYKFGLGSTAGIYLAAGPQVSFNVGDGSFDIKDKQSYTNTFQMKKSNFSINLGAGVYVTSHLEIGFNYNIAMGKTADIEKLGTSQVKDYVDDAKARTWQISAAYFF